MLDRAVAMLYKQKDAKAMLGSCDEAIFNLPTLFKR